MNAPINPSILFQPSAGHLDQQKLNDLKTLLSRGLNTWEDAPAWLLTLSDQIEAETTTDSMGLPMSCGKPLCHPGEHHPLCRLYETDQRHAAQEVDEPNAKLMELADRIDHEKLWRRSGINQMDLPQEKQDRLLAGVMLRRYADLLGNDGWRIFPPRPGISFRASTLDKVFEMAKRNEGHRGSWHTTQQAMPVQESPEDIEQAVRDAIAKFGLERFARAIADLHATPEQVVKPILYASPKQLASVIEGTCPGFDGLDEVTGGYLPVRTTPVGLFTAPLYTSPAAAPDTVPLAAWRELERDRDYWRIRVRTTVQHTAGEVWYWQGDGEDHLESLVNSLPVVIRADQLRKLLSAKPEPVPAAHQAGKEG